jgi:hypothetical protein
MKLATISTVTWLFAAAPALVTAQDAPPIAGEDWERDYDDPMPQDDVGTGGSGQETMDPIPEDDRGTGGAGQTTDPATRPAPPMTAVTPPDTTEEDTGRMWTTMDHERVRFTLGGGVEGYAGNLNDRIAPGFAWGATLGVQPLSWMGAEIAYTGAANEVDENVVPGNTGANDGADLVRNGGHIAVSFNAPTRYVQPYALAGIGIDRYSARGESENVGFRDDTAGRIPLGAGLRSSGGGFTADLRLVYDVVFDQDFAGLANDDTVGAGYTGMLQVGGRF